LPDVSKCLCGIAHAGDGRATLHGVVFDIFDASGLRPTGADETGRGSPIQGDHSAAPAKIDVM